MKNKLVLSLLALGLTLVIAMPSSTAIIANQATPPATMAATSAAGGFDPAVCFRAAATSDKMVSYKAKPGPYKIGISNSLIGNAWRTQMIQMAKAYAETPDVKSLISDLTVVSSGQDVEAQIAQMDNMIAQGVDAIVLDAATPEAFNAVVKRAADAGISVVSFDNTVTAPEAVLVNEDQVEFGRVMGEDLVKRMNGTGNVVMVTGAAGTSADADRNKGAKEAFGKAPGIKILAELDGEWDTGKVQTVMADFLATKPKIDGVWVSGGSPGILQAFKDAKYPLVPMAGEGENAFRRGLATMKDQGLVGISVAETPELA